MCWTRARSRCAPQACHTSGHARGVRRRHAIHQGMLQVCHTSAPHAVSSTAYHACDMPGHAVSATCRLPGEVCLGIGNKRANAVWEAELPPGEKPTPDVTKGRNQGWRGGGDPGQESREGEGGTQGRNQGGRSGNVWNRGMVVGPGWEMCCAWVGDVLCLGGRCAVRAGGTRCEGRVRAGQVC